MGAATCQAQTATGASPVWANAEGGVTFNLADNITATTPIAIPTSPGTNFSWLKNLGLAVTVAGTTTISNRRISLSGSPATGFNLWYKAVAVGSYAQAASGNRPASSGSNGATPSGYTAITTSLQAYDSSSVASSGTGLNGSMAVCVVGVDDNYNADPGIIALPNVIITYDEA